MNVITKKIARSLGQFSVVSVNPTEKPDVSCPLCSKEIENHFAVFECDHYCCTECLDSLADGETPAKDAMASRAVEAVDVLFVCPICSYEVKNIEYK